MSSPTNSKLFSYSCWIEDKLKKTLSSLEWSSWLLWRVVQVMVRTIRLVSTNSGWCWQMRVDFSFMAGSIKSKWISFFLLDLSNPCGSILHSWSYKTWFNSFWPGGFVKLSGFAKSWDLSNLCGFCLTLGLVNLLALFDAVLVFKTEEGQSCLT